MLRWLLKFEGYPPSVLFALLLHGGLILFLIHRQFQPQIMVPVEPQLYINATLIQENPQQQRSDQRRAQQQQQQQAREREQQRQAEAERQRQAEAEKQRQAEAEKQRQAEAEKQRQAEAEKQRQAEAETERQAEAERQRQAEAAEAERQRQAQAAANAGAETAATNLQGLIVALISENWTRPPSARNGMTAVVEIRMTPTGEIVSITITQSSGDAAFDRSVEQAVRRVGRIPEMRDLPNSVFERTFRAFTLTFTPEDLLR